VFHLIIARANFFLGRDGLHRLLAAFNLLHKYLKEKGYLLKLADRALQFEVRLLLQQQDETIYDYFEKCKEASYKADSLTKKLPLSILNAMFDLIVKIEDNLGDTWLGYVNLFEKLTTFLGSRKYNQLLDEYAQRASRTEEEKAALTTFKSELDRQVSDGSFSLYAELHYDVSLVQSEFEVFFRALLEQATMPRTLIENLQRHFDWKRKRMQLQQGQGEDLPPTKITAFELTDALHQLWTYHLLVTLYQQLSKLNVTAIVLLGLPFNEEEVRFGLTQEEFLCLFTTVNSGKLTTLPGLSGSRPQNKWQSETLAHLDRSLGGKGHSRRREGGDELDLSLSSKALNAITLCLASFLNNEVSKRFKLFLSTTASCQDEAMQTLQCMYAYFGTYLIQFELVSGARDAHHRSVALIKWASRDVISMAFAVKLLDAALKHVTVDEFVSQNESVENRFKNEPDPHFSVNLCFGTAKRTFQVKGRGSGCFVATCLNLKAALSLVFQTSRRNASCKELAQELWGSDWRFDFSQQPVGTIMKFDAVQPGVSTNLNVGLGFSGLGGGIGFAHLSLSSDALVLSELVGVNVDGQSLNNATEEDDDEEGRASGDDNESVPVQREERNSLEEESTSPPQGKSLDLLKTTSTKRPQNHSNAASDAAGKRKRSGKELAPLQQEDKKSTKRKSRKKSGTKSTSGRGHSIDTGFVLNLLGYLYGRKELGDEELEDAVRKCGFDPANYNPAEHYQRYQAWMWSNLKHLGLPRSDTASDIFDRGNRNGNGNVRQQEGREKLNARAFFGTAPAAQPVGAGKGVDWEQEQNTEPAAKGKEKAQRMAGKQSPWNEKDFLFDALLDGDKLVDSDSENGNGKHPSIGLIGGEGKNIAFEPEDFDCDKSENGNGKHLSPGLIGGEGKNIALGPEDLEALADLAGLDPNPNLEAGSQDFTAFLGFGEENEC